MKDIQLELEELTKIAEKEGNLELQKRLLQLSVKVLNLISDDVNRAKKDLENLKKSETLIDYLKLRAKQCLSEVTKDKKEQ